MSKVITKLWSLLIVFLLCFLAYQVVSTFQHKLLLLERGKVCNAVLFKIETSTDVTSSCYFKFTVNNVVYKGSFDLNYNDGKNIGDTIRVVYLEENPTVNAYAHELKSSKILNKLDNILK